MLLSAWAEFIGYIGSITLSAIKLRELGAKEAALVARMEKKRKVGRPPTWGGGGWQQQPGLAAGQGDGLWLRRHVSPSWG